MGFCEDQIDNAHSMLSIVSDIQKKFNILATISYFSFIQIAI